MKRIIVIGCPGSGKSTFSRELHKLTKIPLFHLDMMFWNADKTRVEKTVFMERLSKVLLSDEWILDGNYASTMEVRMKACDTVIFLDYPVEVCLEGISKRKGKKRSDIPWTDSGEPDEDFVEFVKNYQTQSKPQVLQLLQNYSEKNIAVFKDRKQAKEFLRQLSENRR